MRVLLVQSPNLTDVGAVIEYVMSPGFLEDLEELLGVPVVLCGVGTVDFIVTAELLVSMDEDAMNTTFANSTTLYANLTDQGFDVSVTLDTV